MISFISWGGGGYSLTPPLVKEDLFMITFKLFLRQLQSNILSRKGMQDKHLHIILKTVRDILGNFPSFSIWVSYFAEGV